MSRFISTRLAQTASALAAALLAVGSAAPLQAATAPAGSSTTSNASAEQPRQNNARSERRICVRMALSNTRIARRVCRTQAEWDREGGVPNSTN